MNVSIIINTYNRGSKLRECLRNLRHLNYEDFEVIVVNGPSTDDTEDVCRDANNIAELCKCPEVNLSMSRNIGIAAAVGEICAFVDDDALTHPSWLSEITAHYDSPKVVGVGGYTLDNTGTQFQATATLCDRLGQDYSAAFSGTEAFCFPGSPLYPSLLGTNSSFRRDALVEIGGFNDVFAYFLDETDVCLRLVDNGGVIKHAPRALVYHRFAPSHVRNPLNVPKTRFLPIRSKAYFMLKHGLLLYRESEIAAFIEKLRHDTKREDSANAQEGRITGPALARLSQEVDEAIKEAYQLAASSLSTPFSLTSTTRSKRAFQRYPSADKATFRIAFISRGYPPEDTNGIARWTHLLAKGLAAKGHIVHVITLAEEQAQTSYKDGVWVHQITQRAADDLADFMAHLPLPHGILEWSASAYHALQTIGFDNLDIVSAPIWDVEGLAAQLLSPIPVVVSLHTTYKLAKPYKPDWRRKLYLRNHVEPMEQAEAYLFACASHFLGNSKDVVASIDRAYGVSIAGRTRIVPHGTEDFVPDYNYNEGSDTNIKVLFVGRRETRKGFDTALAAAANVCQHTPSATFRFIGQPCDDPLCNLALTNFSDKLNDRITIEGYVSDDELDEAYRHCDVFIAPSRYESFGLVAIEAMRYAKPVIVGNRGGLREIVTDQIDGFLVDPDDPTDLTRVITRLVEDPALRKAVGRRAREKFLKCFTVDSMVSAAESAYAAFAAKQSK